jgi:hypothetical protein
MQNMQNMAIPLSPLLVAAFPSIKSMDRLCSSIIRLISGQSEAECVPSPEGVCSIA